MGSAPDTNSAYDRGLAGHLGRARTRPGEGEGDRSSMQTRQPYRHVHAPASDSEEAEPVARSEPRARHVAGGGGDDDGEPAGGLVEEFVRFCRRRRRVGWPELYDEMCAVAGRGIFRGWGFTELAEHGIGFTLADMPRLAGIVQRVVQTERTTASVDGAVVAGPGRGPRVDRGEDRLERPAAPSLAGEQEHQAGGAGIPLAATA